MLYVPGQDGDEKEEKNAAFKGGIREVKPLANIIRNERDAMVNEAMTLRAKGSRGFLYGLLDACIEIIERYGTDGSSTFIPRHSEVIGMRGDPLCARWTAGALVRLRKLVFGRIRRETLSAAEILEIMDLLDRLFEPALEGLLEPWDDPQPTKDFISSCSMGKARGELAGRAAALMHRKARGWIEVAGTRMCLMDIPGG